MDESKARKFKTKGTRFSLVHLPSGGFKLQETGVQSKAESSQPDGGLVGFHSQSDDGNFPLLSQPDGGMASFLSVAQPDGGSTAITPVTLLPSASGNTSNTIDAYTNLTVPKANVTTSTTSQQPRMSISSSSIANNDSCRNATSTAQRPYGPTIEQLLAWQPPVSISQQKTTHHDQHLQPKLNLGNPPQQTMHGDVMSVMQQPLQIQNQQQYRGNIQQMPKQNTQYTGNSQQTPQNPQYSGYIQQMPQNQQYPGNLQQTPQNPQFSGNLQQTPQNPQFPGNIQQIPLQNPQFQNINLQMQNQLNRSNQQVQPNTSTGSNFQPTSVNQHVPQPVYIMQQTPAPAVPSSYLAMGNIVSGEDAHLPSELLFPGDTSVTLRVPQKIRDRILADQYVDLKSLLQTDLEQNALQVQIELKDGQPTLVTKPSDKREIKFFDQWLDAFLVFMAIRHPEVAPMVQHVANIKLLSKTQGAWKLYDENFRYWRQINTNWPWGMINNELWAQATAAQNAGKSKTAQLQKAFRPNTTPYTNRKPCSKYHYKGEFCSHRQCTFSHKCPSCQGLHRATECTKAKSQRKPETTDVGTGQTKKDRQNPK